MIEIQRSESNGHVLTFNDGNHRYSLNGKPVTSVTTVNKQGYPESPRLTSWKIGQGAAFAIREIRAFIKKKTKLTVKLLADLIKRSKTAYVKPAEAAANIGSIVHDYAHAYEHKLSFDMERVNQHPDKEKIQKCISQFLNWVVSNQDEIIKSEEIVASTKYWYAGKFDRLAIRKGVVVLTDYKTSSGIFIDQFIQLAGYTLAIEEWMGIKVDVIEIVRFGKDGSFETKPELEEVKIQELKDQFIRNLQTAKFRKENDK